jgi:hypothetical protein
MKVLLKLEFAATLAALAGSLWLCYVTACAAIGG